MSALTDRLSEDDLRELAALLRRTHARTAARLERERLERGQQENETGESTADGHGGAAAERGEGP